MPDVATVPMPWLMLTDVALVLDHESVDAAPEAIDVGDAVSVAVGSGVVSSVTVVVAVTEPTALVAVTV